MYVCVYGGDGGAFTAGVRQSFPVLVPSCGCVSSLPSSAQVMCGRLMVQVVVVVVVVVCVCVCVCGGVVFTKSATEVRGMDGIIIS